MIKDLGLRIKNGRVVLMYVYISSLSNKALASHGTVDY